VVHHDDQRGTAAGQPGDEHGRPQRPRPRDPFGDHGRGGVQQRLLVAGRPAGQAPDVPADVEVGVLHPDRPPASRWYPGDPLSEPGECADPFREQLFGVRQVERRARLEDQDRGDLLRHRA
jgi:hypothetical protein